MEAPVGLELRITELTAKLALRSPLATVCRSATRWEDEIMFNFGDGEVSDKSHAELEDDSEHACYWIRERRLVAWAE